LIPSSIGRYMSVKLRPLKVNPNRVERVHTFDDAGHFALVNVRLGQDAASRPCCRWQPKQRRKFDVEVQMRPIDLSAVRLRQQRFKVGFLLQLVDRDLPDAIGVLLPAPCLVDSSSSSLLLPYRSFFAVPAIRLESGYTVCLAPPGC
jgi:hypothetical protein